jgi:hypothetical protein
MAMHGVGSTAKRWTERGIPRWDYRFGAVLNWAESDSNGEGPDLDEVRLRMRSGSLIFVRLLVVAYGQFC